MISKELNDRMKKDLVINRSDLDGDYTKFSITLDFYLRESDRMLRAAKKADRDYQKALGDRYHKLKFSKEHDEVLSDRELDRQSKVDTLKEKEVLDEAEADYAFMRDHIDNFKQRSFSINGIRTHERFLAGDFVSK